MKRARSCSGTMAVIASTLLVLAAEHAGAGFLGTDLFLPMVGRNPGIHPSDWYSKVWVYNPGPNPADVRFYYLERSASNISLGTYFDDSIPAGDTRLYENVVSTMFGKVGFGAMRVLSLNGQGVMVNSRVYSQAAGAGEEDSLGQQFGGVPASFAIGLGEPAQVLGVHQTVPASTSELRYNFGFVETTGHDATVRITVWSETGVPLDQAELQVREYSQRQVAFKDHFPTLDTENARLTFEVVSGTGKIIAYGSGIANTSQDPTTFEMAYSDDLLMKPRVTGVFNGTVHSKEGAVVEGGLELEITAEGLVAYSGWAGLHCASDFYALELADVPVPAVAIDQNGNFQALVSFPYDDGVAVVFTTSWTLAGQLANEGVVVGTLSSTTTGGSGDWAPCNGTVVRDFRGAWSEDI